MERDFQGLPSDVDVSVGSSVVLPCQAPNGNPSPSVSWKKDGQTILFSSKGEESVENTRARLEKDSLVIDSVIKADAGKYQCIAENVAALRESPVVNVGIHGNYSEIVFCFF